MNSENLGVRIMQNGALDQKIWYLEVFSGKTVFSGGSEEFLQFLEWLEGIGAKYRTLAKFGDFCGVLEGLERVRTFL
jgi:hypothetical protein